MPKTPPSSAVIREATSLLKKATIDYMAYSALHSSEGGLKAGIPKDPKARLHLDAVEKARKNLAKLVGPDQAASIAAECINEIQRGDTEANRSI